MAYSIGIAVRIATMEFIDTHCHLPKSTTKSNEQVIRAKKAGVIKIVAIGTSIRSSGGMIKRAKQHGDVFSTVSVYPNKNMEMSLEEIEVGLRNYLDNKEENKIVGIGECGFDITEWVGQRSLEDQKKLFELHISLAKEYDLPIVLHNRNGDEYVLEILKRYPGVRGVAHCFTQDLDFAHSLIEYGWFISFTGMLTYESNKSLREVATKIPIENIVIETDAPYLVPKNLKGLGVNEPKNVLEVAKAIAELKNITIEEVARVTTLNAKNLFSL